MSTNQNQNHDPIFAEDVSSIALTALKFFSPSDLALLNQDSQLINPIPKAGLLFTILGEHGQIRMPVKD